jgi:hypothetical protein
MPRSVWTRPRRSSPHVTDWAEAGPKRAGVLRWRRKVDKVAVGVEVEGFTGPVRGRTVPESGPGLGPAVG